MVSGGTLYPDYGNVPPWRTITFPCHTDERGSITVAQIHEPLAMGPDMEQLPWKPARVYWLHNIQRTMDNPTGARGAHATNSESIIIPVSGGFNIKLDDGISWYEELTLLAPRPGSDDLPRGMHLNAGVWRDLVDFFPGTVVLCMSPTRYEDTEYIRDRKRFLVEAQNWADKRETLNRVMGLDPLSKSEL
jgi:hypothetical protein